MIVLMLIAAVLAVVGIVLLVLKKNDNDKNKGPLQVIQNSGPNGNGTLVAAPKFSFQGAGPAPPNTYTFSTAGPRYGATTGALAQNIQAINSPVANWVGSFAPPEVQNPRCA